MTETAHYVQTFKRQGRRLVAATALPCRTPDHARLRAEKVASTVLGVVAYSVTGEPEFGDFDAPVILATFGEVPGEFG